MDKILRELYKITHKTKVVAGSDQLPLFPDVVWQNGLAFHETYARSRIGIAVTGAFDDLREAFYVELALQKAESDEILQHWVDISRYATQSSVLLSENIPIMLDDGIGFMDEIYLRLTPVERHVTRFPSTAEQSLRSNPSSRPGMYAVGSSQTRYTARHIGKDNIAEVVLSFLSRGRFPEVGLYRQSYQIVGGGDKLLTPDTVEAFVVLVSEITAALLESGGRKLGAALQKYRSEHMIPVVGDISRVFKSLQTESLIDRFSSQDINHNAVNIMTALSMNLIH